MGYSDLGIPPKFWNGQDQLIICFSKNRPHLGAAWVAAAEEYDWVFARLSETG